jgi:hypothetical protein
MRPFKFFVEKQKRSPGDIIAVITPTVREFAIWKSMTFPNQYYRLDDSICEVDGVRYVRVSNINNMVGFRFNDYITYNAERMVDYELFIQIIQSQTCLTYSSLIFLVDITTLSGNV